jgi:hypothetical protein
MATQMKTLKGDVDSLNRYGIADAARTRITAQILRTLTKPSPKQTVQVLVPNNSKAKISA